MTDTLATFGTSFQNKAISAMLGNCKFLEQAHDIIDPAHFETTAQGWVVQTILNYFRKYKDVPSMEVFKLEMNNLPDSTGLKSAVVPVLKDVYINLTASDITYVRDQYLTFCKNQTLKTAILSSADKLKMGDYDSIKTIIDRAMRAGQDRDFGHNWKIDIEKRLIQEARVTVKTPWDVINQITDGGLGGGELGVIVAPPGIGKSWLLAYLGKSALGEGKKVLHYTLELNEEYLGIRYDTLFTGIEPREIRNNITAVRDIISNISGELLIKYFSVRSVSSHAFQAHIEHLSAIGFKPDIMIVDYADLLRPSEKADTRYQELGLVYEDLRRLGSDLGIPVWTASQSQRSSMHDDVIEADKIAESFNKVMTADFIMSFSRKLSDKVTNTGRMYIIKNRFGPDGLTFPVSANFVHGKIEIYSDESPEGAHVRSQMGVGEAAIKDSVFQKFEEFRKRGQGTKLDEDMP